MQLDNEDAWVFILSTIRYAMGRRSYITQLSQDLFHKYKDLLTWQQIDQVYHEVAREVELYESFGQTLGDKIDHDIWKKFVEERPGK